MVGFLKSVITSHYIQIESKACYKVHSTQTSNGTIDVQIASITVHLGQTQDPEWVD